MSARPAIAQEALVQAYRHACELELEALKPGNVHVYADGHGMRVEDFRTSALVTAEPLTEFAATIGDRILSSIQATRDAVDCNTNLGIILLSAPLLQAAQTLNAGEDLRDAVGRLLSTTTRADADKVYQAIRLAAPAGLGRAHREDIRGIPSLDLRQVMEEAAHRDRIAKQYACAFDDVFDVALPGLRALQSRWGDPVWAVTGLYLDLLGRWPDAHVTRKYGVETAAWTSRSAAPLAAELIKTKTPHNLRGQLFALDEEFKRLDINPGTTADLTVATVLAGVLEELLSNSSRDGSNFRTHFEQLSACC